MLTAYDEQKRVEERIKAAEEVEAALKRKGLHAYFSSTQRFTRHVTKYTCKHDTLCGEKIVIQIAMYHVPLKEGHLVKMLLNAAVVYKKTVIAPCVVTITLHITIVRLPLPRKSVKKSYLTLT
jgi:hypothetical protein